MSVVAVRITDNGYEIASDSITVKHCTQEKGNNKHSKLIEVNDLVIGCVGRCEESALLQLYANTRKPHEATEFAILEWLSEFAEWKGKKTDNKKIENEYLIAFKGIVFSIEYWFINIVQTYKAIGAGMDFALASLYMGHSVEEAVKTACELSILCELPVKLIKKSNLDKLS